MASRHTDKGAILTESGLRRLLAETIRAPSIQAVWTVMQATQDAAWSDRDGLLSPSSQDAVAELAYVLDHFNPGEAARGDTNYFGVDGAVEKMKAALTALE